MKQKNVKIVALVLAGVVACTSYPMSSATGTTTMFPAAGFALAIGDGVSLNEVIARADETEYTQPTELKVNTMQELASAQTVDKNDKEYKTELPLDIIKNEQSVTREDVTTDNVAEEIVVGENSAVKKVTEESVIIEAATETEATNDATTEAVEPKYAEENIDTESDIHVAKDKTQIHEEQDTVEAVEVQKVATAVSIIPDMKLATMNATTANTVVEEAVADENVSENELAAEETVSVNEVEQNFKELVVAQVRYYVNVRAEASEESEIIGKLYNNCVGTFLAEENGWYKIKSGNVEGYVSAEYCVTGEAAEALVEEIGEKIATVTTTTLKVRKEPGTDSEVLGLVPEAEELSVLEVVDGWVKVSIEEGEGYVSSEYVSLRVDFVQAESRAEEEARLKKEEEERQKARAAANARMAEQAAAAAAAQVSQ